MRWLAPFLAFALASPVAFAGEVCRGPRAERAILSEVSKWGPKLGAPVGTLAAIAGAESDYRPDCVNTSRRNAAAGGAWGPFGMTITKADEIAPKLRASRIAGVSAVASRWAGHGEALKSDLALAVILAAYVVGGLTREFGQLEVVLAAYHQGANAVRRRLAAGLPLLRPRGRVYVARAMGAV